MKSTSKPWQDHAVGIAIVVVAGVLLDLCPHPHRHIEAFQPATVTTMKTRTQRRLLMSPPQSLSVISRRQQHLAVSSLSSLSSSLLGNSNEANEDAFDAEEELLRRISTRNGNIDLNSTSRPNKLDLYGEDELASLLDLHKQLYPTPQARPRVSENGTDGDEKISGFPGIHDLVLQNLQQLQDEGDDDEGDDNSEDTPSSDPPSLPSWLSEDVKLKMNNIVAIASDVDGTIIGSDQRVHPRTIHAIKRAVEASTDPTKSLRFFFPATGKSRAGALNSLGPELASLLSRGPGVYVQGVYCVDCEGNVIFEKKLPPAAVKAAEALVAGSGTSIIAYDGDALFTTDLTSTVLELHELYGEPLSQEIPALASHPNGVHKILICDNDVEKLLWLRPRLEDLATANGCVVTQAIPTMLELLPEGCSKAFGVQKLCDVLGIDPSTQLLALGDAENDVGMLDMAAVGVAVGNANNMAKEAADVVLPLSSTDGGVGLALEVIGGV
jgi:Cof subfamily protein (haloacid dehalogenase superfamily)